jgi:energy-converting hydrogenase Eha subunit E
MAGGSPLASLVVAGFGPASLAPPLQLQSAVVGVVGTFLLFSLFLSLTAFIAARNVLGDVPWRRYLLVGPPVAAIAFLGTAFDLNPVLVALAALLVDAGLLVRLHDVRPRLQAAVVFIHVIVTVLLGVVLGGLVLLLGTAPG